MVEILYKWLIFSFLLLVNISHPYYVSVVEMRNNPQAQRLELTCRMFTDDLEEGLKNEGFPRTFLTHPANKTVAAERVFSYLNHHLKVGINGQQVNFSPLGYEVKEDAVNAYLQVPFNGSLKKVEFNSTILYREHPEQTGIFHVLEGEKRESRRLVNPDSLLLIRF